MQIYGREPPAVCQHTDKSCVLKHCDSGDMFLICCVTSRGHIFIGLYEFMGGSPSGLVTTLAIGLVQVEI